MRLLHLQRRSIQIAALAAATTLSCSLIVDTSARTQCQTSDDCDANPLWRGRVCDQGFCAIKQEDPGIVSKDPEGCTTTDQCTNRVNGHTSGQASLCRKVGDPCFDLETVGCPRVLGGGQWRDPNVIMIGSIQPFTTHQIDGKNAVSPYAVRVGRAIDTAAEEINDQLAGGIQVGGKIRPFSVLHCDSNAEEETAKQRFDFLVDQVGVKSVIVGWTEDFRAIAQRAKEKDIAIVCSDCQAPFPAPIYPIQPWQIIPSIQHDARLGAWRIQDLETRIKTETPSITNLKVVIVSEPFLVADSYRDELRSKLVINGQPALSQSSTNFISIAAGDPRRATTNLEETGIHVADEAPNVVVIAMAAADQVIRFTEDHWPDGKPRPFYLLTQLNYEVKPFESVFVSGRPDVHRRVSGTYVHLTPALKTNLDRFESAYHDKVQQQADGSQSGYEAFYAMFYATAASVFPDGVVDGPHINAGFAKLTSGAPVDFTAGQIQVGYTAVLSHPINVRGITTELDWDPITHEVENDFSMFCFVRESNGDADAGINGGWHMALREAGDVLYSSNTQSVTGTYACPPDAVAF